MKSCKPMARKVFSTEAERVAEEGRNNQVRFQRYIMRKNMHKFNPKEQRNER